MITDDIKRYLLELKESKPALFTALSDALKKEAVKEAKRARPASHCADARSEHGEAKIYATMVKHVTCAHCGHKWERTVRLGKGDALSWCERGRAKQAVITRVVHDPIHIHVDVMDCHNCARFITSLSRNELEDRYIQMLIDTSMERMAMLVRKGGG